MDKNELMHKVQVYADRTSDIVNSSSADSKTKILVQNIVDETCNFFASVIQELCK